MKTKKILVAIAVLLLATALFYWFQWRPVIIRSSCDKQSRAKGDVRSTYYAKYYEACLHEEGLK